MKPARVLISTAMAIPLMLAACSGGGGSPTATDRRLDELRSDPRVVRLEGVLERADTLVIPNLHLRYSFSSQGVTLTDELVVGFACSGLRCVAEDDGTEVTIADLVDPSSAIASTDFELGSRGGFDTATLHGVFEVEESIPEITLTAGPTINSYGFWGAYGFAAIDIVDATVSGLTDGTEISGSMGFAGAYIVGDTSGSNPGGTGTATWTGIAEAASTARPSATREPPPSRSPICPGPVLAWTSPSLDLTSILRAGRPWRLPTAAMPRRSRTPILKDISSARTTARPSASSTLVAT